MESTFGPIELEHFQKNMCSEQCKEMLVICKPPNELKPLFHEHHNHKSTIEDTYIKTAYMGISHQMPPNRPVERIHVKFVYQIVHFPRTSLNVSVH